MDRDFGGGVASVQSESLALVSAGTVGFLKSSENELHIHSGGGRIRKYE